MVAALPEIIGWWSWRSNHAGQVQPSHVQVLWAYYTPEPAKSTRPSFPFICKYFLMSLYQISFYVKLSSAHLTFDNTLGLTRLPRSAALYKKKIPRMAQSQILPGHYHFFLFFFFSLNKNMFPTFLFISQKENQVSRKWKRRGRRNPPSTHLLGKLSQIVIIVWEKSCLSHNKPNLLMSSVSLI